MFLLVSCAIVDPGIVTVSHRDRSRGRSSWTVATGSARRTRLKSAPALELSRTRSYSFPRELKRGGTHTTTGKHHHRHHHHHHAITATSNAPAHHYRLHHRRLLLLQQTLPLSLSPSPFSSSLSILRFPARSYQSSASHLRSGKRRPPRSLLPRFFFRPCSTLRVAINRRR